MTLWKNQFQAAVRTGKNFQMPHILHLLLHTHTQTHTPTPTPTHTPTHTQIYFRKTIKRTKNIIITNKKIVIKDKQIVVLLQTKK